MQTPVTYSNAVAPMTPAMKVRTILSENGMDTSNITMAPLPYKGRKGPLINPLFINLFFLKET